MQGDDKGKGPGLGLPNALVMLVHPISVSPRSCSRVTCPPFGLQHCPSERPLVYSTHPLMIDIKTDDYY